MRTAISPRITLLIIAALFILPLLLAWMMYIGTVEFEPVSTRNMGTLVRPPQQIDWQQAMFPGSGEDSGLKNNLSSAELQEHWVILYPVPPICAADCQNRASSLRQIHLAAGRHQPRLRVALMLGEEGREEAIEMLESIYANFILITDPSGKLQKAVAAARATITGAPNEMGDSYLIDPLGNIMMHYAADANPNHIKQDLKRLLTWSKLDAQ